MSYEVDADALFHSGSDEGGNSAGSSPIGMPSPEPGSPHGMSSPSQEPNLETSIDFPKPSAPQTESGGSSFPSFGSFGSFRGGGGPGRGPRPPPGNHHGQHRAPRGGQQHPSFGNRPPPMRAFDAPRGGPVRDHRPPAPRPGTRGPVMHPDRLRHIQNAPPPPPRRDFGQPSRPEASAPVEGPISRKTIASILPEDGGLRSRVIEATTERLAEDGVPKRKRPGALRKRPRPDADMVDVPRKRGTPVKRPTALFGDLSSLGRSVVASKGGTRIPTVNMNRGAQSKERRRAAETPGRAKKDAGGASKPVYRSAKDVYSEATLTKEVREREERIQAEEDALQDAYYGDCRKKERQERRVMAETMRGEPTVSSFMRDSHLLDRVERHFFSEEEAALRDSLSPLNLSIKDIGSDPRSEELWTVLIEEF